MDIGGTLRAVISSLGDWLRGMFPGYPDWLIESTKRVLQYFCGPILDNGGRYPWFGLVAALAIATSVYLFRRGQRDDLAMGGFWRFCFPREIYRTRSTWVDLKLSFFNYVLFAGGALNVTWRITSALFASWVTYVLAAGFGPVTHHATWGPVAIVLFMIAYSMASDFGYFLFHWASHVFPPLWAIHKVHHSAEVMTPLTAARVHPLEHPILGPFRAVTVGLLVGPMLYLYGGETDFPLIFGLDIFVLVFFTLGHVLHHSHVWVYFGPIIGRVIVSPAQHQIHHSCLPRHLDKNFAEHWSMWDTIFGTLYLPQGRETLKLGLAGYQTQPHPGLAMAWFRPVIESVTAGVAIGWRCLTWPVRRRGPAVFPAALAPEQTPDPG